MQTALLKTAVVALLLWGTHSLCRTLLNPLAAPMFLMFWGSCCFLFGGEIARRLSPVPRRPSSTARGANPWKVAGIVSWTLWVAVMMYYAYN